jgi:hypothetical protein
MNYFLIQVDLVYNTKSHNLSFYNKKKICYDHEYLLQKVVVRIQWAISEVYLWRQPGRVVLTKKLISKCLFLFPIYIIFYYIKYAIFLRKIKF